MNIMQSKKQMIAEVVKQYARNVHISAYDGDYEECLNEIENLRRYVYRAKEDKRKLSLLMQLNEHSINGKVPMLVYQQDCDLCESCDLTWIDATTEEYDKLASDLAHNVEGPWQLTMLNQEEAKRFIPSTRDLAAEAMGY